MPYISDLPNGNAIQASDLILATRGSNSVVISGSEIATVEALTALQNRVDSIENANSGVKAGTYIFPSFVLNAKGQITAAANTTLVIPTKISDLRDDIGLSYANAVAQTFSSLADVNIQGNAAIDGQFVYWDNTAGKFQTKIVTASASNSSSSSSTAGGLISVDSSGRLTSATGPANTAHKAWRLRMDHVAGSNDVYCSVGELQFRQTAGTAVSPTGGTAFSSATGNGTVPGNAFDGDPSNRWVGSYPSTGFPKYVGYIYATPVTVVEMAITASGISSETPTAGALEYSDDTTNGLDGTWATATTFTTGNNWGTYEVRVFANGPAAVLDQTANVAILQSNVSILTANVATLKTQVATLQASGGSSSGGSAVAANPAFKYFKLFVKRVRGNTGPGFSEIQFRTTAGGAGTTITAATSSADNSSYPVTNSFDGNTSTFYTYGNGFPVQGVELSYTLASAINLAEIYINPRQDGFPDEMPMEMEVFGSADGISYTSLGLVTPNSQNAYTNSLTQPITFPGGSVVVASATGSPLFAAGGTFEYDSNNGNPLLFSDVSGCTMTRIAAGRYYIAFSTPMADANYGVLLSGKWGGTAANSHAVPQVGLDRSTDSLPTTSGFYIVVAGNDGSLYDGRVSFAVYKNASALVAAAGSGGSSKAWDFSPPKVADFTDTTTLTKAGVITTSDDADVGMLLQLPAVGGDVSSAIMKPVPTSGDWTITMKAKFNQLELPYGTMGLMLYYTNGTAQMFGADISRRWCAVVNYNAAGGYNNTPTNPTIMRPSEWYRLQFVSATNTLTYLISAEGKLWSTLYSAVIDPTQLTLVGPGFASGLQGSYPGYNLNMSIPYWKQSF